MLWNRRRRAEDLRSRELPSFEVVSRQVIEALNVLLRAPGGGNVQITRRELMEQLLQGLLAERVSNPFGVLEYISQIVVHNPFADPRRDLRVVRMYFPGVGRGNAWVPVSVSGSWAAKRGEGTEVVYQRFFSNVVDKVIIAQVGLPPTDATSRRPDTDAVRRLATPDPITVSMWSFIPPAHRR